MKIISKFKDDNLWCHYSGMPSPLAYGRQETNNDMSIEVKNCVGEIIDTLCDRGGFDDWWYNLDDEVEKEITDKLEEIVKRRFEKYYE